MSYSCCYSIFSWISSLPSVLWLNCLHKFVVWVLCFISLLGMHGMQHGWLLQFSFALCVSIHGADWCTGMCVGVCVDHLWPSLNLVFPLGQAPKLHIVFLNQTPHHQTHKHTLTISCSPHCLCLTLNVSGSDLESLKGLSVHNLTFFQMLSNVMNASMAVPS